MEIKQIHERKCFKANIVAELTCQERVRDQEGLMLLTRKKMAPSKVDWRVMEKPREIGFPKRAHLNLPLEQIA